MKVLGIDPGTTRIGYGFIESTDWKLIAYGVLEVTGEDEIEKIADLGGKFSKLLISLAPDVAGVEGLFFGKNRKTALAVSQARGVILSFLAQAKIPIRECRPAEVKLSVAGYGAADKAAVAAMVKKTLHIEHLEGYDDASDALAIAIATAAREPFLSRIEAE